MLIVVVGLALPASSQCLVVCGDYSCNGSLDTQDLWEITRWLYQTGPESCLLYSTCENPDSHEQVTIRDVVFIWRTIWGMPLIEQCDTLALPLPILPNDDFYLLHETRFPAGDSLITFQIDLVHHRAIAGASVAFVVKVGGVTAIVTGSGITLYPPGFVGKGMLFGVDGYGLFGYSTALPSLPPSRRPLVTQIDLHSPPSLADRAITVELVNWDSLHSRDTVETRP